MKYTQDELAVKLSVDSLEPEVREGMLASFYRALDNRVAVSVATRLTDEQLAKLDELTKANDEQGIEDLLRGVVPDYDAVIDEEADKLLAEIEESAKKVLGS